MEDRFGPYTVYECLGAGGMATVHRASIELEDDETREVALKRLLPQLAADKRFIDDFIREGKLAAQLQHPNIVRILELGRIGKTYFIAMDLVRGRPLMTLMRRAYQKRLPAPIGVILGLMREMVDALEHAHDAQIVHRDLTPSNLIITDEGHLKIIDFGVAKALAGNLQTSSGLAKGKLGYMSMEAIGGKKLDTRADIFSAGVVMWELIATKRLFKGNEIEIINQIRDGEIPPPSRYNPDCPTDLDAIVLKALERDKDDRWSSAGDIRDALDEIRRFHRGDTSAQAVVQWMTDLRGETVRNPRLESDGESTVVRLSTSDMFDSDGSSAPGGEGDELAMGSQRGAPGFVGARGSDVQTYDDTVDEPEATAVGAEPVREPTADNAHRFKDREQTDDGAPRFKDREPTDDGAPRFKDREPTDDGAPRFKDREPTDDGAPRFKDAEQTVDGAPKFKDVDTIVSTFQPRKP